MYVANCRKAGITYMLTKLVSQRITLSIISFSPQKLLLVVLIELNYINNNIKKGVCYQQNAEKLSKPRHEFMLASYK